MYQILKKRRLSSNVVLLVIDAPYVAKKAEPGQFIILRVDAEGERIPLTISEYDREKGTITIVVQEVGATTIKLGQMEEGDCLHDFVGPLGIASELEGYKRAAVVGGGLGCAIAYPQAKKLHELGCKVDLIAGFKNTDAIILEDEMRAASTNLYVMTDDGSNGNKGFVTTKLQELLEAGEKYDVVIAIGPMIMMKFVSETTRPFGVKTIVSMNTIMVDGTGMCGGCRLTVGGETKFACVDGPDFDGHQVDFDEAMRRAAIYKPQEQAARDHQCNLMKMEVK
ncbi:sulfide/dihydroorotate dehydrogenase-like FAD/NAD-binding protein [Butyricicoccus sp.]|uniref:sulfide/dihydroorotate dehydrogenase-like FAD/NAD-binding protein n=1 Tax=Butyricicoccus sp. TaxID=2049021 RepID=UPI002A8EBDA5|nr:sulfide/dihydroorotate dehydrogenase-like FAD/NAD-binding protein [Butyricicoccus sp.]